MNIDTSTSSTPLSITFETPGRATIIIEGSLTNEVLPSLHEAVKLAMVQIKTAASTDGRLKIFMDLSKFSGKYDTEALEVMVEFAKANSTYVAKTAVLGGTENADMTAEVTAALAGRENIKAFATKTEAEAWLNEPE